jgi:serine/threonine protein kinase
MNIQCPACLNDNPNNSNHCGVCGYQINQLKSGNKNHSGIYLNNGILLKNGIYQIENILAEGGFGITYKGKFISKNIPVTIKELWPEKAARQDNQIIWPNKINVKQQQEQINKFKLEAQNQRKCSHPNIPKIYDFFLENNTAYIVMEYIEGKTLYSILKSEGKFTEARLKPYILQIIDALRIIHNNNFLHRDIKPDNIILDENNHKISLIDFGSTKEFIAGQTGDMTRVLTPGYAPSEQYIYSAKRDKATDIYALCSSLYELLTNKLPIESLDRLNAISNHHPDPLIPPRQIVPEISLKMERIILTGMKIKVEERFQNVDELLRALQGKFISPLHQKAQELVKQNNLNQAIKTYQKCLQQEPENGEAAVELALVQIYINPTQTEIDAETAIKLQPQDGRSYGILGLIKCRQKNWQEAVILLKKAANLAPQEAWIQANLAWALGKCCHWSEATKAVNQALELNNNCAFSLGLQAWININQGEYKQAVKPASQAIFKSKNNISPISQEIKKWVYPYLIFTLDQAVVTQEATDIDRRIKEFINQFPNGSYAWGLKGWKQAKNQDWNQALLTFQKADNCPEIFSWILLNHAIVLEHLNKIPEAIKIYTEVSLKFPDNALCFFRLGTLTAQNHQWQQAKKYLEKAIAFNPNYPEAYHNLAWVILKLSDCNSAQEILTNYQQAVKYYQQQNKNYFAKNIQKSFQNIGFNL